MPRLDTGSIAGLALAPLHLVPRASDMAPHEAVLGFPGAMLDGLMESLEELAQKAIPRSHAKQAYQRVQAAGDPVASCGTEADSRQ